MLLPTEISAGKLYSKHKIIQSNLNLFYVGSHSQNWLISSLLLPPGECRGCGSQSRGLPAPTLRNCRANWPALIVPVPWLAENAEIKPQAPSSAFSCNSQLPRSFKRLSGWLWKTTRNCLCVGIKSISISEEMELFLLQLFLLLIGMYWGNF